MEDDTDRDIETDDDGLDPGTDEGELERVDFQGIPLVIEYHAGDFRINEDSVLPEGMVMMADYGYVENTISNEEGDELDVFVGDDPDADTVYLIPLLNADQSFNEIKCFLGFDDEDDAEEVMAAQYEPVGMCYGQTVATSVDDFRAMCESEAAMAAKLKRLHENQSLNNLDDRNEEAADTLTENLHKSLASVNGTPVRLIKL